MTESAGAPLILVVDDVEDNRSLYAEYLLFRGYRVSTAETGLDALDMLMTERPDVILLDLRMPGLSGEATLGRIRTRPELSRTPVVALTAHALDQERRQALAAGFDFFLSKPCLPDDVVRVIESLLGAPSPIAVDAARPGAADAL